MNCVAIILKHRINANLKVSKSAEVCVNLKKMPPLATKGNPTNTFLTYPVSSVW